MKYTMSALAAFMLLFGGVAQTRADFIVGNFDLNDQLQPITSLGQVTFTLNGDGTIAASLVTNGFLIQGFGVDSPGGLSQSNFSPAAGITGWQTNLGLFFTGFDISTPSSFTETWTIGTPGEFTSVYQALGGGNAKTEFLFITNFSTIGAVLEGSVPEPSGFVLLGAGCMIGAGYFGWQRRRKNGQGRETQDQVR